MNQTQIIGNIGKDGEVRETNGNSVLNFTVAVNESYKNKDGVKVTNTTWISASLWGSRGKAIAPYIKAGGKVFLQGKLSAEIYDDKNGQKQLNYILNVRELELLGGGEKAEATKEKVTEKTAETEEAFD